MRFAQLFFFLPLLALAANPAPDTIFPRYDPTGLCTNATWNCGQCFLTFRIGQEENSTAYVWQQFEVYDARYELIGDIAAKTPVITNKTTNATWLRSGGFDLKAVANHNKFGTFQSVDFWFGSNSTTAANSSTQAPMKKCSIGSGNMAQRGCVPGIYGGNSTGSVTDWQGFCGFPCAGKKANIEC